MPQSKLEDSSVWVSLYNLYGGKEAFDLQSLVGVIREGRNAGELIRVGDENQGMDEETYWQVHPPRNRPQA